MAYEKIEFKSHTEPIKGQQVTIMDTPCPHGQFPYAGSSACGVCKHNVNIDDFRKEVTCSFDGDMTDVEMDRHKDGPNV